MKEQTATPNLHVENVFTEGYHLCYIYNDDKERAKTMAKFFAEGLNEKNKVLCIVDSISPHDIREEIKNLGVDVETLDRNFITIDNESAYYPNGNFDPDSVLKSIGFFSDQAREDGYSGLHVCGDMAWVLRNKISTTSLMEYETKVLAYQKLTPCTAICEYDARKFDGATLMDILCVHPAILIQGQIVKNPYFIQPDKFMAQYYARKN